MKGTLDFIRGMVRPTLALSAWAVVLAMTLLGRPIPPELWTLAGVLTAFYFGDRAARKGNTPTPGG